MRQFLVDIKVGRLRQIDGHENMVPLWRRAVRRYKQLSQVYPPPVVWFYFFNRAFHKAFSFSNMFIFQNLKSRILKRTAFVPGAEAAPDTVSPLALEQENQGVTYAIKITGGLGDALIVARLVRDIQDELGGDLKFDVYYHSPRDIEPFFKAINGFRECIHADVFHSVVSFYDFSLVANQFVIFVNEHLNFRKLLKKCPKVINMFGNVQSARKPIEKYISAHPALDGAFADMAVRQEKKRHTYLHEMLGIAYGGDRLPLAVDLNACVPFGLVPGKFITVHDGWDNKFKLVAQRPTKALPLATAHRIVQHLKELKPEITIVQLGGKTGENIRGVDVCLKGKLSFSESISFLAASMLHIDTESGLVHLAAALGVKSVVMFGPTNMAWFGYPQNVNIGPKRCGNCWWSTDSWMDICPIGLAQPECTASIDPEEVAQLALSLFRDRKTQ